MQQNYIPCLALLAILLAGCAAQQQTQAVEFKKMKSSEEE